MTDVPEEAKAEDHADHVRTLSALAMRPGRSFTLDDLEELLPLVSALAVTAFDDERALAVQAGFVAALGDEVTRALYAGVSGFDDVARRFLALREAVVLADATPARSR